MIGFHHEGPFNKDAHCLQLLQSAGGSILSRNPWSMEIYLYDEDLESFHWEFVVEWVQTEASDNDCVLKVV